MPMRRVPWLIALLLFALALSACRIDTTVTVDIERNGSGNVDVAVAVSEKAIERIPDLAEQLQLDDLRQTGWKIEGPSLEDDGNTWIRAIKPFASPDDLPTVLDEIGIFNNIVLTRERSFAATEWSLAGEFDVTGGVDRFGDAELAELLGGRLTGVDVEAIETDLRKPIADTLGFSLVVRLGDDVDANSEETDGRTATWTARVDDVGPTPLEIASSVKDDRPRLLALIAIAALAAAFFVLVLQGFWAIRRRLRSGFSVPDPQYAEAPVPVAPYQAPAGASSGRRAKQAPSITDSANPAAAAAAATGASNDAINMPRTVSNRRSRSGAPQLVILDAMGVIYRNADDVEELLIPFVQDHGGVGPDEVRALYQRASLGELSSAELWEAAGLEGDPGELDRSYLSQFRMTGGLLAFLDKLSHKNVPVACVCNDVSLWSRLLRQGFDLDTKIGPWIVSGDIGARKPDAAIYEALRTTVGAPFDVYLLIDDRVENLDAARDLGMRTALFAPDGVYGETNGHRVVRGFSEFFRR